jgi:hypothetical protein
MELDQEGTNPPLPKYHEQLRAPVVTTSTVGAPKAKVHSVEWAKVMAGAAAGTCVQAARVHRMRLRVGELVSALKQL